MNIVMAYLKDIYFWFYFDRLFELYILKFWVGLLDGDGTIVVNLDKRNKRKYFLRYRFTISLSNNAFNFFMFSLIQIYLKGSVNIERKQQYITWSIASRSGILRCVKILNKYPLLTSRKICQFNFLVRCFHKQDINYFLKKRDLKYSDQPYILDLYNNKFVVEPSYFGAWLSGFVEAEGSFRKRKNKRGCNFTNSFNIGQNYDFYLINSIKKYFKSSNKIQLRKNSIYYVIDMYGNSIKLHMVLHFLKYPLLGAKYVSYSIFINNFNKT